MWWVANKSKLLSFQEVFLKRRLSNFVAQVSQIWRRTIRKYDFTYLSTVKSAFCLKVSLLSGQVEHMWTVGFCPRFLFSDALTLFQFGGVGRVDYVHHIGLSPLNLKRFLRAWLFVSPFTCCYISISVFWLSKLHFLNRKNSLSLDQCLMHKNIPSWIIHDIFRLKPAS